MHEPPLTWDGSILHGETLEEVGIYTIQDPAKYNQGKVCPVCLDPITNEARTCRFCQRDWKLILSNPRLLAEWIVAAKQELDILRGTVVWQKGKQVEDQGITRSTL